MDMGIVKWLGPGVSRSLPSSIRSWKISAC